MNTISSRGGAVLAAAAAMALSGALSGCSAGGNAGVSGLTPQSAQPQGGRSADTSAKQKMKQIMYLADRGGAAVYGFPATSNGNVSPTVTISGANTLLGDPLALTVDASGNIYVANDSGEQIEIFPAGSNGNATPQVLGGSNVPLKATEGIAIDHNGEIYVSDYEANQILVFAPGSTGNTAPIRTIVGPDTGLTEAVGMAFDSNNNLYVANYDGSGAPVLEFSQTANGDARPIGSIGIAGGGGKSGLYGVYNVAIGKNDEILVENKVTEAIDIFTKGAKGDIKPNRVIAGEATQMSYITSIGLDSKGYIYVTNIVDGPGTDQVLVFTPTARNDAAPVRVLSGANTLFGDPYNPSFN